MQMISYSLQSVMKPKEKAWKWQRYLEKKELQVNTAKMEVLNDSRGATKGRMGKVKSSHRIGVPRIYDETYEKVVKVGVKAAWQRCM